MKWYETPEGVQRRNETYKRKFKEKYGVENPQQLKEIKLKASETCIKKYGGRGFASPELDDKSRSKMEEIYGYRNIMKNDNFKFTGDKNPLRKEEVRKKVSRTLKGKPSKLKGKSYEEILGPETTERRKKELKKSGAYGQSLCTRISKPQLELYAKIKDRYPSAVLEFPVLDYCIDIAVPELKLAFEYDGAYWHPDPEKDRQRDLVLEQLGWRVERVRD